MPRWHNGSPHRAVHILQAEAARLREENPIPNVPLMSKREAAARIGVDPRTLNRHMRLGTLPFYLVGKVAVFDRREVDLFKRAYWY